MDCQAFHRNHSLYVDELLSGVSARAMREHARLCTECAAHDAKIRRALLLVRNLPVVRPSTEFSTRLKWRIDQERMKGHYWSSVSGPQGWGRAFYSGGVLLAIALTWAAFEGLSATSDPVPRLPGVVARPPAVLDSMTAPAILASMSAGMPVWPALWLAEQAPFRYVSYTSRRVSETPTQP
jgi:hypothetical protein